MRATCSSDCPRACTHTRWWDGMQWMREDGESQPGRQPHWPRWPAAVHLAQQPATFAGGFDLQNKTKLLQAAPPGPHAPARMAAGRARCDEAGPWRACETAHQRAGIEWHGITGSSTPLLTAAPPPEVDSLYCAGRQVWRVCLDHQFVIRDERQQGCQLGGPLLGPVVTDLVPAGAAHSRHGRVQRPHSI